MNEPGGDHDIANLCYTRIHTLREKKRSGAAARLSSTRPTGCGTVALGGQDASGGEHAPRRRSRPRGPDRASWSLAAIAPRRAQDVPAWSDNSGDRRASTWSRRRVWIWIAMSARRWTCYGRAATRGRACRSRTSWPRSVEVHRSECSKSRVSLGASGAIRLDARSVIQHELVAVEQGPEHVLVEGDIVRWCRQEPER